MTLLFFFRPHAYNLTTQSDTHDGGHYPVVSDYHIRKYWESKRKKPTARASEAVAEIKQEAKEVRKELKKIKKKLDKEILPIQDFSALIQLQAELNLKLTDMLEALREFALQEQLLKQKQLELEAKLAFEAEQEKLRFLELQRIQDEADQADALLALEALKQFKAKKEAERIAREKIVRHFSLELPPQLTNPELFSSSDVIEELIKFILSTL